MRNHKALPIAAVIAACGLMSFAFQNCAKAKFAVDSNAKAEVLGTEQVFVPGDSVTPGDDSNTPGVNNPGTPPAPRGDDANTPGKNPNGNDPKLTHVPVNFSFECSNSHSEEAGGNLLTSEALKIVILDKTDKVACELNGDFKTQILNTKKVTFTPCAGLAAGKYEAHIIIDAKNASGSHLSRELTQDDIAFIVNADGTYSHPAKKIGILYDFNNQNSRYASDNKNNSSTAETQKNCDSRVSPLIISMNSEAKGIKLSAPLQGIQFDILGENSFPMAHDKKQISWLAPADITEYYFIVLPNKNGKVLGINEMFGDNTRGPDGKFSANGYAALGKHDGDKDGLITEEDEVFSELRLWIDRNRDGAADTNELYTLKEKNITVIDLHYDKRYKETDQYGNQTLMKSVVKTEDGKLHLLFDLWFRYLNITK